VLLLLSSAQRAWVNDERAVKFSRPPLTLLAQVTRTESLTSRTDQLSPEQLSSAPRTEIFSSCWVGQRAAQQRLAQLLLSLLSSLGVQVERRGKVALFSNANDDRRL